MTLTTTGLRAAADRLIAAARSTGAEAGPEGSITKLQQALYNQELQNLTGTVQAAVGTFTGMSPAEISSGSGADFQRQVRGLARRQTGSTMARQPRHVRLPNHRRPSGRCHRYRPRRAGSRTYLAKETGDGQRHRSLPSSQAPEREVCYN